MTRKDFLKMMGAGSLVGVGALLAAKCSSSSSPSPTGQTKDFTSTTANGHSHTFTMNRSDIDSPPSGGITRDTATTDYHSHSVTVSQSDLMAMQTGASKTVTTSAVNADGSVHTHDFTFSKWY
jgi:hypothetical protein